MDSIGPYGNMGPVWALNRHAGRVGMLQSNQPTTIRDDAWSPTEFFSVNIKSLFAPYKLLYHKLCWNMLNAVSSDALLCFQITISLEVKTDLCLYCLVHNELYATEVTR